MVHLITNTSTETCAIDLLGGKVIREVSPGEIVRINSDGLASFTGREPGMLIYPYKVLLISTQHPSLPYVYSNTSTWPDPTPSLKAN
jgi:glutamine phosphoribosylpyrophosphate amidotransferase